MSMQSSSEGYGRTQQAHSDSRGSAAFNEVMHLPEGRPQAVFRLRSSAALADWRYPLKNTAACYCFATAQSELLPLPDWGSVASPV
jgi:hypothetical protein